MENWNVGATRGGKLSSCLAILIQYMNVTDGQTDRHHMMASRGSDSVIHSDIARVISLRIIIDVTMHSITWQNGHNSANKDNITSRQTLLVFSS